MHVPLSALITRVDRLIGMLCKPASLLVIPLSLLLFVQWPLREWIHAYSREANDLAQCLFAWFVSVAITYATRMRAHLAADAWARQYSSATRARLYRYAAIVILVPWSAFMLWSMVPGVWRSLLQLERFPETWNPGYFVLRLAMALCTLLVLAQALVDAFAREQR